MRPQMNRTLLSLLLCTLLALLSTIARALDAYAIEVLDSQTDRGVSLVTVVTPAGKSYVTDSNGIVAFAEAELMNRDVVFTFSSYGYRKFKHTLHPEAGGSGAAHIQRLNRAERLYRVTGADIYRDSVLTGAAAPIAHPLFNANVKGQDSVQYVVHRGKIFWFWGDTLYIKPIGPLKANLRASGATSLLPSRGGLDPAAGIDLDYFTRKGSVREMMPLDDPGLIWLDGVFEIQPPSGGKRILGHFVRVKSFLPEYKLYEQGMAIYSDLNKRFQRLLDYPLDAPITPRGHAFEYSSEGEDYIYFNSAYPNVRVRKNWLAITDIAQWQAYSPFRENTRYDPDNPPLERDGNGKVIYGWKKNTSPLSPKIIDQLVSNGYIEREQTPFRLVEWGSGREISMAFGSVNWNSYRDSWIMIGTSAMDESALGEVWFAEAPAPEGPWEYAVKIATHHGPDGNYTFYNPASPPFLSQQDHRVIYFMGTYSTTPFGTAPATPLYDYNQIMYRLDLSTIPPLVQAAANDNE